MLRHVYGSVIVLWMPLCMLYIDLKKSTVESFTVKKSFHNKLSLTLLQHTDFRLSSCKSNDIEDCFFNEGL